MFAALLRGVVVLGIVSWYSTSVWKMIDGYFKDQFQKYLREEYAKNPKMRADVDSYNRSGTAAPTLIDIANQTSDLKVGLKENVILGGSVGSSVHANYRKEQLPYNEPVVRKDTTGVGSGQVKEVDANTVDNINVHSRPPDGSKDPPLTESVDKSRGKIDSSVKHMRWTRPRRKPEIVAKIEPSEVKVKKRKIKTIQLTESDFEEARKKMKLEDQDFSEFDEEMKQRNFEPVEGIPVRSLPYRPRVELYDLEKISEDEFCPLSLEEDINCDETKTWP